METMHAAGRRRLPPVPRPAGDRSASGQVAVAVATDETDPDQFATQVIDTRQIAAELIEAELAALTEAAAEDAAEADDAVDDDAIEATQQLQLAELVALIYEEDDDDDVDDETQDEAPDDDQAEAETSVEVEAEAEVEAGARGRGRGRGRTGARGRGRGRGRTGARGRGRRSMTRPSPPSLPPRRLSSAQDPAQQFVARLRSAAADFAGAAGAESAVVREAVPPARHRRARCRLVLRYADGALADVTLLGPAGSPGRPSRHGFDRQILRWLGAGLVQDDAWLVDDPDAPEGVAVDLTAWVAGA